MAFEMTKKMMGHEFTRKQTKKRRDEETYHTYLITTKENECCRNPHKLHQELFFLDYH